jgi:ribonuclease HII
MSEIENLAWSRGYRKIAGIDEAGRGALAGPVIAACVMLDPEQVPPGIDDSKKLTNRRRRQVNKEILKRAISVGVGSADCKTIDQVNIYNATKLAMKNAVLNMTLRPDFLLIDAVKLNDISISSLSIVKGDQKSVSIAAASIVAKVYRDDLMIGLAERYPEYLFASNKGYGTEKHRNALQQHGPTAEHRLSFVPVRDVYERWKLNPQC